MGEGADQPAPTGFDTLVRLVALGGGLVLLAVAAMVVVSVTLRSDLVGWAGVPGDFELIQMGTAVAAFCFLPWCQLRRGNIFVDTFTLKLPQRVQNAIDGLWDLVFAFAMALISWRLAVGARAALASGENTMVLQIPSWLPIGLCAVLAALVCATSIVSAIRVRHRA